MPGAYPNPALLTTAWVDAVAERLLGLKAGMLHHSDTMLLDQDPDSLLYRLNMAHLALALAIGWAGGLAASRMVVTESGTNASGHL